MYTTLSLSDSQVETLKEILKGHLGNIKSQIRHSQSSEIKDELKGRKNDMQNMLDQIEGNISEEAA